MSLTRRQVLRVLGSAAAIVKLPLATGLAGCGDNAVPNPGPFTNSQRRALAAFADVVLPPDDQPGGADLGAVAYIERLLHAFDASPPAIFADGPFSGRTAFPDGTVPPNDFARFLELDRVNEAAWRLEIFGGTAPDGSVRPSLYQRIAAGLDAAIALRGDEIDGLSIEARTDLFDDQDEEWKALMVELVTEAAFAAPEYGGNPNLAGWRMVHFEGDSQPLGYSPIAGSTTTERPEAPLSTPNPGDDPEPLDSEVDDLIALVATFLGGRSAP
jgi:hypothetical protein